MLRVRGGGAPSARGRTSLRSPPARPLFSLVFLLACSRPPFLRSRRRLARRPAGVPPVPRGWSGCGVPRPATPSLPRFAGRAVAPFGRSSCALSAALFVGCRSGRVTRPSLPLCLLSDIGGLFGCRAPHCPIPTAFHCRHPTSDEIVFLACVPCPRAPRADVACDYWLLLSSTAARCRFAALMYMGVSGYPDGKGQKNRGLLVPHNQVFNVP